MGPIPRRAPPRGVRGDRRRPRAPRPDWPRRVLGERPRRAAHDARPLGHRRERQLEKRSDRRFGAEPEVALTLPDGRRLTFAGSIDRIEELPDGRLVVTDHKTGSARGLDKVDAGDPTLGATHFQLPVYAAAARAVLARPD